MLGARDALGNGPLHYAAAAGLQSGIRFLAQRGAPVSEANKDGRSPAMLTLQGDSTAALEELIRLGANLKQRDSSGASALHLSVLWNARACMALLAELGTGIDPRDFTGKTPLRLAVDRKDISGVGFLLSKGANPLARDNIGETPLHIAARLGETASLKQLMEKVREGGMDERDDAGTTALLEAVYAGSLESAALLAQAGASIHAKDSSGESPLSQAARNGQASLRAVLNRGNIFHSDSDGRSVLRVLLDVRADAELFQAALSLGTLLDGRDAAGRTPLMLALSLNRLEVVALLANAGADPFARDADGSTPMGLALSAGDDALRALFEKQPNRADELGDSALHYAAALGGEAGAALLLSLGADPTVRNASGETPADVAKRRGHGSLAELLAPNR